MIFGYFLLPSRSKLTSVLQAAPLVDGRQPATPVCRRGCRSNSLHDCDGRGTHRKTARKAVLKVNKHLMFSVYRHRKCD